MLPREQLMAKNKIMFVFGTRPEAIKLAPLILKMKADPRFEAIVCSTGQHREMLKPILDFFSIKPDYDFDIMKPGQTLLDVSISVMSHLKEILQKQKPDALLVQGDTTSCFIASLVSFYEKIPLIHIEAGLRSGDINSPFPEEFNRRATALTARWHIAPTQESAENLIKENFDPKTIHVTGNTGIDALFEVKKRIQSDPTLKQQMQQKFSFLSANKKLILVTVHRRESFGKPMEEVMKGICRLAQAHDVEILIPLHMNPEVRKSAEKIFKDKAQWVHSEGTQPKNIWLCEPLDYVPFVHMMSQAHFIITDSGGVQEEAPSFGKPILVAREKTERMEAIQAGTSKLIPLEENSFYEMTKELLESKSIYDQMAQAKNPFGDGNSCHKILEILARDLA